MICLFPEVWREGEVTVGRDPQRSDGGERLTTAGFLAVGVSYLVRNWKRLSQDLPPEEGLSCSTVPKTRYDTRKKTLEPPPYKSRPSSNTDRALSNICFSSVPTTTPIFWDPTGSWTMRGTTHTVVVSAYCVAELSGPAVACPVL